MVSIDAIKSFFFEGENMWLSVITSKTNSLPEDKTQ